MSYAKDRVEFIAIMAKEKPPMPAERAKLVMRVANTLQKIAADDCSNEPAYTRMERERKQCPVCKARFPTDRQYSAVPSRVCREHAAEAMIEKICKPYSVTPVFSGDPRGAVVKLKVPSGYNNSFGGEGVVCVPTREY